jgi:hypothetical protein
LSPFGSCEAGKSLKLLKQPIWPYFGHFWQLFAFLAIFALFGQFLVIFSLNKASDKG